MTQNRPDDPSPARPPAPLRERLPSQARPPSRPEPDDEGPLGSMLFELVDALFRQSDAGHGPDSAPGRSAEILGHVGPDVVLTRRGRALVPPAASDPARVYREFAHRDLDVEARLDRERLVVGACSRVIGAGRRADVMDLAEMVHMIRDETDACEAEALRATSELSLLHVPAPETYQQLADLVRELVAGDREARSRPGPAE